MDLCFFQQLHVIAGANQLFSTKKQYNKFRRVQMAPKPHHTEIPALFIKCNSKMKVLKVNILTIDG